MQTVTWDDLNLTIDGMDAGVGDIYYYKGAPLTGSLQYLFPDGKLQTEITCLNGYPEGVCREYYSNGQIMEEGFIKYNLDYGSFKQWDENGNLIDQYDFGPEPSGRK